MTDLKQAGIEIPEWAYVYSGPQGNGKIKQRPEDFIVEEQLSFQPEGCGEHAFLQIEKCGENTEYIARLLARFANVRQRDVSYAGLKDRHAKTTQWFSVWLPGKEDPAWQQLETENIKIIQISRHARKLKRGVLSGNKFQIVIRDCTGDKEKLEKQLHLIKHHGMANYFGPQRFGRQGHNINNAIALFKGRKVKREQRSMYLSAARSFLFNCQLSKRIELNNWNQAIAGDVMVFDQSNSYFKTEQIDESVLQRIKSAEIHPTGMMFGKGKSDAVDKALEIEQSIIDLNTELAAGLVKMGLSFDRRALRVRVRDFDWKFQDDSSLLLNFFLPSGSYATSLIRELVEV